MKLYWGLVLPVLMYGLVCWTLTKEDERRLLVAEMAWLRRIRGRSRRERIRRAEKVVIEKIKRRRLEWFGWERMEGKRLLMHGYVRGERSKGRQRKRWMDNFREDLEERGIQLSTAYEKNQK